MSMDNAISFDELEQRRRRASAARKPSHMPQPNPETTSEAMAVIQEIFNPSLKLPETTGPYKIPDELSADDLVDAMQDLDIKKLAELREVFLLFDTDCDGLISKDDLRFTYGALGGDVTEEILEDMLKEAKEPLDVDAFVELMSHRTIELDPEDVLLEAWSKWDDYGTGKIDEKSCFDYVEIFPHLREPVIENSTNPEYVICNRSSSSVANSTDSKAKPNAASDLRTDEFIYSASKVFGIRVRFQKPQTKSDVTTWPMNITGEYRFLKRENFKNDGRLIPGSFCDYYFFANADATPQSVDIWKYFHSPRFPATYPAHIKCSYKFIGRPDSRVEIIFDELHLPKQEASCSMDKLTIFDSESANMNAVIDVVCNALPTRRILSSGPDLLIEFNASSNVTAKGFRGKFKFLHNEIEGNSLTSTSSPTTVLFGETEAAIVMEKLAVEKHTITIGMTEFGKLVKGNENCKFLFVSTNVNKSGKFDTQQLFTSTIPKGNSIPGHFSGRVLQCRFEFYGNTENERIQIKFLDFNIPTEKNSTECKPNDSLQLLTQVRGKYEAVELYCGPFLPKPIMSIGPKIILQFLGKYPTLGTKVGFYGFKAEYRFLTNFGISTGHQLDNNCTFTYNSTDRKSGWFGSPNFPGLYPHNMECNYYFYGSSEEKVVIRFNFFDVEGIGTCEYLTASDYVEFSNFMSTDRKYARYCGRHDKFEVGSDGRFFRVTFVSNDRFDKTGFRALYDFESKNTPVENTSVQGYVSSGPKKVSSIRQPIGILIMFLNLYCFITRFMNLR